jgi:arylsulfatase A-like enzyme
MRGFAIRLAAAAGVFLALIAAASADARGKAHPRPNILVIMADDLGFSDIGPYGGEIATPNLDALARDGRLMTSMYATPMPHTSHAEFLFGVDHHLVVERYASWNATATATGAPPASGTRGAPELLSIARVLKDGGYHTYMIGTWDSGTTATSTPAARGFESSHALVSMAGDYFPPSGANVPSPKENFRYLDDDAQIPLPAAYITDVWTDRLIADMAAAKADGRPFFAYAAYTTPHFPLQAKDADIARQRGRYDAGYDAVRLARIASQKAHGLIALDFKPSDPVPESLGYKRWDHLTPQERAFEARRMEVYAAMVENLDWNIGRMVKALKASGQYRDTLIVFTSTNGAAQSVATHRDPKGIDNSLDNLGRTNSWIAYDERWAEVSNAPFSRWKAKATEGGVAVPLIVHLPGQKGAKPATGAWADIRDLGPTLLAFADVQVPGGDYSGRRVEPYSGVSLRPLWEGRAAVAHAKDAVHIEDYRDEAYVRKGAWKAVLISDTSINAFDGADPKNAAYIAAVQAGDMARAAAIRAQHPSVWKLYDIRHDRGETTDLAARRPQVLKALVARYAAYKKVTDAEAAVR